MALKNESYEDYKKRLREYYHANRDRILAQRKARYAADPDDRQKTAQRVRTAYVKRRNKFDQLGLDSNGFRSTSRRKRRATAQTAKRPGGCRKGGNKTTVQV